MALRGDINLTNKQVWFIRAVCNAYIRAESKKLKPNHNRMGIASSVNKKIKDIQMYADSQYTEPMASIS